nr:protein FAR1-related sequence 5-like [Tanacetum cinerariifolium]
MEMDSILEDAVDECNLANPNDNLIDTIPEMFTDKHTLDYSSPPLYDECDDDIFEFESDTDDVYNDPFDSKEEKINESKLLIDELDLPRSSDFLPSLEYDSFLFEDFLESSENHRRRRIMDEEEVNKLNYLNKDIIEQENEVRLDGDDDLPDVADPNTVMEEVTSKFSCDSALKEPHVEEFPIPVEGTYYDTIDKALDIYTKYAEMAGFEIKKRGQRLTKSGVADEVAKCNYKDFGDIVSFDATFNNNKYNMKFVPFTCIDNYEKCVTLGLGMLLHEDTKSYTWLQNAFITAFSHEPTMIVTNQDEAMKRAIEAIFKKAKHRLCMWHIMQKIPSKICKEIYDETNFKEHFHKIVWNMFIEPLKFEEKWSELIEDFGLQSHKWLTKIFNLREIWIPTYFIDSPVYGLMRTTSGSESENSFFKSFTSPGATLVSFMISYESAMERKRYRQEALDFKTIEAASKFETKLQLNFMQHEYIIGPYFCLFK